jgi:hypothetical protein
MVMKFSLSHSPLLCEQVLFLLLNIFIQETDDKLILNNA